MGDDDQGQRAEGESEVLIPQDVRNVRFPGAVRGYDRAAVDAYVKRVNRVIAELEVRSSPRAAVRHALEQVGEQTSSILQRARQAAEEITASARQEAEEATARAKAEAAELVVGASTDADRRRAEADQLIENANTEAARILAEARSEADKLLARTRDEIAALQEEGEARLRDLHADIAETWKERRELLEDVRGIAEELQQAASRAAARMPSDAAEEATAEAAIEPADAPEPEAIAEAERTEITTSE